MASRQYSVFWHFPPPYRGAPKWMRLVVLGCALLLPAYGPGQEAPSSDDRAAWDAGYRLNPGDQVFVEVLGHDDLSGSHQLDSSGRFSMPLVGEIDAAGLTASQLEASLVERYRPDYLVNPQISVRVENFRPYYLMGEVGGTGAYAYQDGMTYLEAIARAGGYSYRARKGVVYVIRAGDTTREEVKLDVNEKVQPGDIIRIAERLF